jgi:hypothetical protein
MISQRAKRIGLKELEIFDNFHVDQNLPKHKKEKNFEYNEDEVDGTTPPMAFGGNNDVWVSVPTSNIAPISILNPDGTYSYPKMRRGLKQWLINKLQPKSTAEEKQKVPMKLISVVDFFTNLSGSYEELTPIAEIATHYENAVVEANVMGQTALLEKLKDMIDVVRGEAHLITMGLKKYVTEKQVIDFYEKVGEDKNLKLTWIQNFNRIIPEDVYIIKKDVDDRKIFDNYVVLHYDPKDNGEGLSKAEIEKKKDPILFGLIKNSRKLYYIADWKDEYCDLTLEEMFNVLGEKVLKINNKSVKTFISKTKVE